MRNRIAASLVALLAACATGRQPAPKTQSPGEIVLARVNGEAIDGEALRREFSRHHMAMDKIIGAPDEVRRYVEKVIDRRLLLQEGRRMGLAERADVRRDVDIMRGEEIRKALQRIDVVEKAKPTDEACRAVYDMTGVELELRQFVAETQAEAEAARKQVVEGADLERLVRERSMAGSAVGGGMVVGVFGTDPAREQVMYSVKEGELSPVFKSAGGWEFFRVEKRIVLDKRKPFEKLKVRIAGILEQRNRFALKAALYDEVRKKYAAEALECPVRSAELRKALDLRDRTPEATALRSTVCGRWTGGTLTFQTVAERVRLERIEPLPPPEQARVGKEAVQSLVDEQLLRLEGEARGYGKLPEVLEAVATAEDDLVEDRLLHEYVLKGIEAKDSDLQAYYDTHKAEFFEPARYSLAQIVVEKPETAAQVKEKLAAGQPFEDLARQYSIDKRSAADGGNVGIYLKIQLTGEFALVADMKQDEVSAPIKTRNGYHLVKVVTLAPDRPLDFDQARDDVRKAIMKPQVEERSKKWVGTLRAAAEIKVYDDAILAYSQAKEAALQSEEARRKQAAAAKGQGDMPAGHVSEDVGAGSGLAPAPQGH
jgi:parvulin-like peptidyl-prolyl isomerase